MDINEDLAECLQKLFFESEDISLRIGGYFTTTRKNRGLLQKYKENLRLFLDYILDKWVEEPRFSINVWNHWNHIETRTNKNNEAYNLRVQKN